MLRWVRPDYEIEPQPSSSMEYGLYSYPFQNFPKLESHAHPHWVILNAGETLLATTDHELVAFIWRVTYAYMVTVDEAKAFVEGIKLIYKRWVSKGKGCGPSRIISFIKKAVDRVRGRATRTQTASSSVAASPQ